MKLDQHFLINEDIAKLMVSRCKISKESFVIEIGPGEGAVTKFIPKCKLTLIEKDYELADELRKKFDAKVIIGDGVEQLSRRHFDFLISSVPYSICEPLINELMLHKFQKAVFIMPKKFVEGILEPKSAFSVIANNLLNVRIIKILDKGDFEPRPRVNSVVAEFSINDKANKVLENVYLQRDKKLKNALREAIVDVLGKTKNQAKELIEKAGFEESVLNKSIKMASVDVLRKITSL